MTSHLIKVVASIVYLQLVNLYLLLELLTEFGGSWGLRCVYILIVALYINLKLNGK
jgi:hypothetical protein